MIITLKHVFSVKGFSRKPGFCRRGVRLWCERHGVDFRQLVKTGVDEAVLLATKDPMAVAVVEQANGKS